MNREGLPTRLISAAPPRVFDLLTSLWRRMGFDVRVRGRCWEDPSRTLRCQRLLFCAELRLPLVRPSPDSIADAPFLFTELSTGTVGTEQSSHFEVHCHHHAAESCILGTPCLHAYDISEHLAALIGCIAARSTEVSRKSSRNLPSDRQRPSPIDTKIVDESTITPQDSPNSYKLCENLV